MIVNPQVKCVVCEREVDPPKKAMKPPAMVICGTHCATQYTRVKLLRAVHYGTN